MQLTGLILENFKSFAERTFVPMAPITLLFGENSAGKSSILQSLLLLKQTARHAEMGVPLLLAKGEYVDLGSIREMLFAHDPDRTAEISLIFNDEGWLYSPVFWPGFAESVGMGVRFGCGGESDPNELVIREFPVYWGEPDKPLMTLRRTMETVTEGPMLESGFRIVGLSHKDYRYRLVELDAENGALNVLCDWFLDDLGHIVQALREWPQLRSIREWPWFHEPDEDYDWRDWDNTVPGYLHRMIEKYQSEGRDLIQELLDRFADYSREKYIEDVRARSECSFPIRGACPFVSEWRSQHLFNLGLRGVLGDDKRSALPSLDGILGALLTLRNEGDELTQEIASHALLGNLCAFASEAQPSSMEVLDRLAYVGPLRDRPSRSYMQSGVPWTAVEMSGTNMPEMLANDPKKLAEVNEALRVLQAEYQVSVVPSKDPGGEGLFWLRLTDSRTGVSVSPLDVGFGVGQVLPVVLQLATAQHKILLFEQPELHLHPRLQAELGSLLARATREPLGNQVIVETHSEYIIYRLQKLIRLGRLKPEDVNVIYVTKDDEGSRCLLLRLDEEGDFLDPWPGGFFDTGFDEMFGLK